MPAGRSTIRYARVRHPPSFDSLLRAFFIPAEESAEFDARVAALIERNRRLLQAADSLENEDHTK
jgi:hypothetical protein